LEGDQLKEMKEQAYGGQIGNLWPLLKKDSKFTLSLLGEQQVDGKPAVGVKVASEGHRDIDLYFDKESNMLVKSESRTLHPMKMKKVRTQIYIKESRYFDGPKEPKKLLIDLDGKKSLDLEILKTKSLERGDENEFAKP